jgi:hypothetical protein
VAAWPAREQIKVSQLISAKPVQATSLAYAPLAYLYIFWPAYHLPNQLKFGMVEPPTSVREWWGEANLHLLSFLL